MPPPTSLISTHNEEKARLEQQLTQQNTLLAENTVTIAQLKDTLAKQARVYTQFISQQPNPPQTIPAWKYALTAIAMTLSIAAILTGIAALIGVPLLALSTAAGAGILVAGAVVASASISFIGHTIHTQNNAQEKFASDLKQHTIKHIKLPPPPAGTSNELSKRPKYPTFQEQKTTTPHSGFFSNTPIIPSQNNAGRTNERGDVPTA